MAATQYFVVNINSDYLYLYETADNILRFKSIAGQNFPPAPYFFPDLFIVTLLKLFTHNITLINLLCSILFLFAFCLLAYSILTQCVQNKSLVTYGMIFALILAFFAIPDDLQFLRQWPASHLSVILFSLFLLSVYLKFREKKLTLLPIFSLFLCSFLLFISDNLLFAQAFFPLTFVMFFDKKNRKNAYIFCAIFFFVTLFGARIDLFLERYFDVSFSLNESLFRIKKAAQMTATLQQALQIFLENIANNREFYLLIFAYNIISMVLLFALRRRQQLSDNLLIILVYFYSAQLFNIILAILCGKFSDIGRFRYLNTVHIFPALALTLTLVKCIEKRLFLQQIYRWIGILLALNFATFFQINYPFLRDFSLHQPYNEFVDCVDNLQKTYPIQHGLGEYWDVKEIRVLSKLGITMTQVDRDFNFYNFIDNQHLFEKNTNYQFVIITPNSEMRSISKENIRKKMGEPHHIAMCANREIWLYTA